MKKQIFIYLAGLASALLTSENASAQWSLSGNAIAAANFLGTTNKDNIRFRTFNVQRMVLDTTGKLGIGVTVPAYTLHVKDNSSGSVASFDGTSGLYIALKENGVTRGYIGSFSGASGDVDFGTPTVSNNSLHLSTTGTPRLTVKGSFVGIGTQSPAINLHVVGGTDAKLNTGGFIVTGPITGANLAIDNNEIMARDNGSAAPLYLNTDGGNVNMCVYGGNVGIGTASPDYSLDVCGVIRAKEVLVSTGWCDYVFADDYRLPDLNEVEKFIKENGHLPEVTKGSEIESCGLDVGKISSQMIKKIEELTLYVIALDKKNQELQKEIDLLKK